MSFELPSPHTYPLLLSPPPSLPFHIPPPIPSLTATAIATPEALAVRTLEGLVLLPELIEARHGMGDAPLVDPPWYSQLLLGGGVIVRWIGRGERQRWIRGAGGKQTR